MKRAKAQTVLACLLSTLLIDRPKAEIGFAPVGDRWKSEPAMVIRAWWPFVAARAAVPDPPDTQRKLLDRQVPVIGLQPGIACASAPVSVPGYVPSAGYALGHRPASDLSIPTC